MGAGSVAQIGNFSSALNVKSAGSDSWIIDTSALDHMTGNLSLLHDYKAYSKNYMVKIADGSLSKVTSTGTVYISPCLKLHSVLLVPSLRCNLLSISKLTKDLNCVAKFSTGYCKFQDLELGKTIGNAKECEGLYFLEVYHPKGQAQTASSVISHV